MELNEQHGFLEELLALRRDMAWESAMTSELFSGEEFGFDYSFFENPPANIANPLPNYPTSLAAIEAYACPFTSTDLSPLLPHDGTGADAGTSTAGDHMYPPMCSTVLGGEIHDLQTQLSCKTEPVTATQSSISSPENIPSFNVGIHTIVDNSKAKKLQGQPSKNLMAERRRRKRLNDRLSMLRSIVPKISKMDRTSILGDTIDYMKELLERIENLQREIESCPGRSTAETGLFREVKPGEVLVRNSPKFDVDRRNTDTRIEICCAGKPGLLYSTVTTLEALGLEIQQCVISCFNDFAMQASCSEDLEKRAVIGPEEVKQALFRNAGYGGKCL